CGRSDLVIAAGVEHMGRVGFPVNEGAQEKWGRPVTLELLERYDLVPQGLSAELIAEHWDIGRTEMDEFSLRSHRLAAEAAVAGHFDREIVPVPVGAGEVKADQGIRPDSSLETLAAL